MRIIPFDRSSAIDYVSMFFFLRRGSRHAYSELGDREMERARWQRWWGNIKIRWPHKGVLGRPGL